SDSPSGAPSDGHAIDLDRRNAHTHGHALPFLAARADAFVELEVVAHHADVLQRLGPVADQGGVAHRAPEPAVLDHVPLRCGEDEIAAGDIPLPAAEIAAVHALRHRADDLFGVAFAGEHEGVGHTRHRNVCVALAPSTTGRFGLEQRTRKLVLQVPAQHA